MKKDKYEINMFNGPFTKQWMALLPTTVKMIHIFLFLTYNRSYFTY